MQKYIFPEKQKKRKEVRHTTEGVKDGGKNRRKRQRLHDNAVLHRKDDSYLMMHRTVKKNDVNKDKWIGVGGHAELGESPEECLLREVKEETGYTLTSWRFRGLVTFVTEAENSKTVEYMEYMCLYTADGFTGEPTACDEGELAWVKKRTSCT